MIHLTAAALAEQKARIAALEAERDALKQDAARYRWLRDADHERIIFAAHYERSSAASSTVDAAIDAARSKT